MQMMLGKGQHSICFGPGSRSHFTIQYRQDHWQNVHLSPIHVTPASMYHTIINKYFLFRKHSSLTHIL